MMQTLAPWLSALAAASLKGSVILVAALLASRAMRRSSAEARHAILAIGLVAFLAVPIASVVAPAWPAVGLPVLPAELTSAIDRALGDDRVTGGSDPMSGTASRTSLGRDDGGQHRTAGDRTSDPAATSTTSSAGGPNGAERIPQSGARVDGITAASNVPPPVFTRRPPTLGEALMLAWLIGASLIGLRLLTGLARLRFLSRRATMVTDGGWLHAAHAIARRLGLTRGITLLRGDREAVPMTWGVLSPVVWLPPAADHWPAELRTSVLSHELAHVRRRDAVMQWIANIAVALHWFNPLVWVATRALRGERERACDDAVLALGAAPDEYAAHLLDMVRALGTNGGPAPAMAMARRSQFEGRLLAILDRASPRGPVGAVRLGVAGAGAAALVLALGGLRTTEAARVAADPAEKQTPIAAPAPVTPSRDEYRERRRQPSDLPEAKRVSTAPPSAAARPHVERAEAPGASDANEPRTDTLRAAPVAPAPASLPLVEPDRTSRMLQGSALSRSDTALLLDVIGAAEGISSSSDRVAVLERVANLPDLAPTVVTALGRAAGRVTSSASRARLLRALVRKQPHAVGESRRAFLDALSHDLPSSELGAVLEEFIKRDGISEPALADAFTTAARISSSTEKARVLVAAARLRKPEGEARAAYLKTAATITNGSDRARALSALFEDPPRDPEGAVR